MEILIIILILVVIIVLEYFSPNGVKIFGIHARIGYPVNIPRIPQQLNSPTFSTILGMILAEVSNSQKRINTKRTQTPSTICTKRNDL